MKTPRTKLAQTIADRALNGDNMPELAREVAAYLIAEGRTSELNSILRDVQVAWAKVGYIEVLAATAHPLSEASATDIRKKIASLYPNAKQIVVTEVHDPTIIGGVRLSLANQQLDLSVEAKLNKFKQLTIA